MPETWTVDVTVLPRTLTLLATPSNTFQSSLPVSWMSTSWLSNGKAVAIVPSVMLGALT